MTFTTLVPVDILERFMALETSIGARRSHLLTLAIELLQARGDSAALAAEVRSALKACSA